MLKTYFTRRPNGLYMLTGLRPSLAPFAGGTELQPWIREGDPLAALTQMCPRSFELLTDGHPQLAPLEPREFAFMAVPLELFAARRSGALLTDLEALARLGGAP